MPAEVRGIKRATEARPCLRARELVGYRGFRDFDGLRCVVAADFDRRANHGKPVFIDERIEGIGVRQIVHDGLGFCSVS